MSGVTSHKRKAKWSRRQTGGGGRVTQILDEKTFSLYSTVGDDSLHGDTEAAVGVTQATTKL